MLWIRLVIQLVRKVMLITTKVQDYWVNKKKKKVGAIWWAIKRIMKTNWLDPQQAPLKLLVEACDNVCVCVCVHACIRIYNNIRSLKRNKDVSSNNYRWSIDARMAFSAPCTNCFSKRQKNENNLSDLEPSSMRIQEDKGPTEGYMTMTTVSLRRCLAEEKGGL